MVDESMKDGGGLTRLTGCADLHGQVQMYHPLAWGFPDSSKISTPNPGEPQGTLEWSWGSWEVAGNCKVVGRFH